MPVKDTYGPKLIDTLINAAIFQLPSYTFIDIGDIIYELMSYERTIVCRWLEETLKGRSRSRSVCLSVRLSVCTSVRLSVYFMT